MELNPQNQLALAALVVALVALIGTILQILAQYFATSEGYRRCGPSVIGEWARFTRRRFKFREFRFEIIFATPHITCVHLRGSQTIDEVDPCLVSLDESVRLSDGEQTSTAITRSRTEHEDVTLKPSDPRDWILRLYESLLRPHEKVKDLFRGFSTHAKEVTVEDRLNSMHKSLVDAVSIKIGPNIENENASWVKLIQAMQYTLEERRHVLKTVDRPHQKTRLVPALRASLKSWDFMPAEIVRPCATTTVSSLATFIQILGLTWDQFSPEDGEFRASSENLQLLSHHVRSLGTVVRLSTSPDFGMALMEFQSSMWSESFATAQLGFGLIPERERLFSFHRLEHQFCFRTEGEIRSVISYICLHWAPSHSAPSGNHCGSYEIPEEILGIVAMDMMGMLADIPESRHFQYRHTAMAYHVGRFLRPSKFHGWCNWLIWADFKYEAEQIKEIFDRGEEVYASDTSKVSREEEMADLFKIMLEGYSASELISGSAPGTTPLRRNRKAGLVSLETIDERMKKIWTRESSHGVYFNPWADVLGLHVETVVTEFMKHPGILDGTNPIVDEKSACNLTFIHLILRCDTQRLAADGRKRAEYSKYTAAQPAPGHSLIMKLLFEKIRTETHRHAEAALLWMCLIFRALCFHSVFVFDGPPNSVPLRYRDDHTIIYIE